MSYNTVDQSTGALKQAAGSTLTAIYADAPVGAIVPYGGDTAPTGYLLCDGSAVSRTTYSDLYAVIGTKYGEGDGNTTFNLPDGEAGAELYPAADVESGIAGSVYIIKAVKTALPTDFQTALDEKQDIVDNALQTTSKEIVGAINEINSDLAANKINDRISLTSYTGSNHYTVDSDGYLFIGAGTTDTDVSVTIQGATGSNYSISVSTEYISGAHGQSELIFIKKGMSIKCNGNYSSTSVMFYPLV